MAYPHSLPDLGYDYDALEPHIDARTMEIHHSKHHAGYTNNLNGALESHPDLHADSAEDLLRNLNAVPDTIRGAVRNNGGGFVNHDLFWRVMTPGGASTPTGELAAAIDAAFGSVDSLKETLTKAAATRFGSGWGWARLDRHRSGGAVHRQPGQPPHGRSDTHSRSRCVGARLLLEVPEPADPTTSPVGGTR